METHQVFNQSPELESINLYSIDSSLQKNLLLVGLDWGHDKLDNYGSLMGEKAWMEKGRMANQFGPILHTHDHKGNRVDEVEFHPSYHDLMELGINNQIHSIPWLDRKKGGHYLRMALFYMHAQNEAGTCCPITMTFASVPVIQKHLPNSDKWIDTILSSHYDGSNVPYFKKKGLTVGMAMTEKQGGTDVRANTTKATHTGNSNVYTLVGHKWFCSAPMCDAFLTLAQTENGISCFLLPRWKKDGTKNEWKIQRLKDKLGNKSNASSEIEFEGASAWLLGEEGKGISVILEMVSYSRYDCMIGSTAIMRRALTEVLNHIQYRKVMGKLLIDQPLMQNVVADLCLEFEASLALTFRTAMCLENEDVESEKLMLRILTPLGKYWITKRSVSFIGEAMECLGGNGYTESGIMARLSREAPLNAIWEGSGNVQCLDVLRALNKEPEIWLALKKEWGNEIGKDVNYDAYIAELDIDVQTITQSSARRFVEQIVLATQACQMFKFGSLELAKTFCLSRLKAENARLLFGNLPESVDCEKLLKEYLWTPE